MTDRFKLEQAILNCWQVVDELGAAVALSQNETREVLEARISAIAAMTDMRCQDAFETFAKMMQEGKITGP